jgi:hypothetical protein
MPRHRDWLANPRTLIPTSSVQPFSDAVSHAHRAPLAGKMCTPSGARMAGSAVRLTHVATVAGFSVYRAAHGRGAGCGSVYDGAMLSDTAARAIVLASGERQALGLAHAMDHSRPRRGAGRRCAVRGPACAVGPGVFAGRSSGRHRLVGTFRAARPLCAPRRVLSARQYPLRADATLCRCPGAGPARRFGVAFHQRRGQSMGRGAMSDRCVVDAVFRHIHGGNPQ